MVWEGWDEVGTRAVVGWVERILAVLWGLGGVMLGGFDLLCDYVCEDYGWR